MTDFLTAQDIEKEIGLSRSSAYKVIRQLNQELQEKGYLVFSGKVPRHYFMTRYNLSIKKES